MRASTRLHSICFTADAISYILCSRAGEAAQSSSIVRVRAGLETAAAKSPAAAICTSSPATSATRAGGRYAYVRIAE